jgi:hypothetical protein
VEYLHEICVLDEAKPMQHFIGCEKFSTHPFRVRAFASLVRRLVEVTRGVKADSVLYAAYQQIK